jgi:hypothetical protein
MIRQTLNKVGDEAKRFIGIAKDALVWSFATAPAPQETRRRRPKIALQRQSN